MLKAGLIGALVSGVVGTLVNDSGVAVLSMVLALSVPLVLAAGISTLQQMERDQASAPPTRPSGPPADGPSDESDPPDGPSDGPTGGPSGGPGHTEKVPGFA
jgi:hypothetical protein